MDHKRVMVVGGGIAGVQASLDLAEMGIEVLLIERGPSIGGRMAQLDKTFPTNDCAMCILSPKLVEAGSHPYIKIITNTDVLEIGGEAPSFRVKLLTRPRYVDIEKCTGCGACTDKCPVKVPDAFNMNLDLTKCISLPFPQAVPAAAMIDDTKCLYLTRGRCQICSKVCEAEAIDYEQKPVTREVEVGSVVLASGSSEFDAITKDEYGYKTFPTNDCAMCILSPKLVEAGSHPYIKIITNTDVLEIGGEAPSFRVKLLTRPRYVDIEKCTGCGACTDKCPVKVPDAFNMNLDLTKCISLPFPQAVPAAAMIDDTKCLYLTRGRCQICSKVCEAEAIDYEQKPVTREVEVGSVVLASGSSEFDAITKDEYGYKTFPTNDCAMCILSPKLVEAGSHPYIKIITNTDVLEIGGEAPSFRVKLLTRPRYVDIEKCTGCGACTDKCPVKVPDAFNMNLDLTKCISLPFPQAVPAAAMIDDTKCLYLTRGRCQICSKVCEAEAIDYEQKPVTREVEVGSVVLASGSSEFDAITKDEYGYKTFPNVVTSIEFERILSASGPSRGHVVRPSDHKEPAKIAFLQCVGSRDSQVGNDYCSSICCMQAAKDAIILGEHLDNVETSVFFMDIRAFGKGFDRFIDKAEIEQGCRFIRARISSVETDPATDNVVLQYTPRGSEVVTEEFDMLVLSLGLVNTPEQRADLKRLGLSVDDYGFIPVSTFEPVRAPRDGIFVCGTLSGPKDIPESVVEASAAAAEAASVVAHLPKAEFKVDYPDERDIRGEPPRVGVFVCNCGINIGATVAVGDVVEYARTAPNVEHAQEFLFSCSQDAQKIISDVILEKNLNRVVVAACTPRTHEPLFQRTLQATGLNPYLFEFVNIREQCSWVHQKEPEKATEKAKQLLEMALSKAALLEPLAKMTLGIHKAALVIGGGIAGMAASLELAAQGFPVHLVEKEAKLGGNLSHVHFALDGTRTKGELDAMIARVEASELITAHTNTTVEKVTGYVGNFVTTLSDGTEPFEHGAVIVATGATAVEPTSYLHGQDQRIVTQREFEERLASDDKSVRELRNVVMIQCVESRDDDRPYCSRVCCGAAVKNALKLKEINPYAAVRILYRDIRTYGLKELMYRDARERGVLFSRFDKDEKPIVRVEGNRLRVEVNDEILGRRVAFEPDLLVLSSGIKAETGNKALSQMLKVPLGPDGFFLEAHVKLRPVDFATDGIFVCGMAHYPKDISEAIAQAKAAAGRAATVLAKTTLQTEGKVAMVQSSRCSGCGTCVEVCAYKAIELDPQTGYAVVNEALCKGCGVCTASCLAAAIDLKGFKNEQILAMLEAVV